MSGNDSIFPAAIPVKTTSPMGAEYVTSFENTSGLTKRELFAAMAMQGLLAHPSCKDLGKYEHVARCVAQESLDAADALIAALEAK